MAKRMDMFGRDVTVSDVVLYAVQHHHRSSSAAMKVGVIINITDKCVVIRELKRNGKWLDWSSGISRVLHDSNIVKYDGDVPGGWVTKAGAALL